MNAAQTTEDRTCEGYSNYATFGVAVTLDNGRVSAATVNRQAERVKTASLNHENVPHIWTAEEAARFGMADWLKGYTERLCESGSSSLMASQMAQAGLAEVNWEELAVEYLNQ